MAFHAVFVLEYTGALGETHEGSWVGQKQLKTAFHVVFVIAASNANWPLTSLLPRRRRPSHPSPLPCNPWPLASGDATERARAAESQALIGKVFTREKSIPNKLWASHSS